MLARFFLAGPGGGGDIFCICSTIGLSIPGWSSNRRISVLGFWGGESNFSNTCLMSTFPSFWDTAILVCDCLSRINVSIDHRCSPPLVLMGLSFLQIRRHCVQEVFWLRVEHMLLSLFLISAISRQQASSFSTPEAMGRTLGVTCPGYGADINNTSEMPGSRPILITQGRP